MIRWPSRAEVDGAVRRWARELAQARPEVASVGYFGSYARGTHGVGSDLDLVVLVGGALTSRQGLSLETLPVPVDALVYTLDEWHALLSRDTRFARTLKRETVWVWPDGAP